MKTTRKAGMVRAPLSAAERMRSYRARRRAAGLKEVRRWAAADAASPVTTYSDHRLLDARSLALHCLIARKLQRDPTLLEIAKRNIARWAKTTYAGRSPAVLIEWQRLLARPLSDILAVMTDLTEDACRLRQSSPFAGILTPAERNKIFAAFRA